MAACANCGHQLGVGRFCTNCGHRVDHSPPVDSMEPTVATASPPPAVEPTMRARYPLFADDVVPPGSQSTSPPPSTIPSSDDPPPDWFSNQRGRTPSPRGAEDSRAGWLPWAAGAAGLILVALIGALLLVTSNDEADPGADGRADNTASDTGGETGTEQPTPQRTEPTQPKSTDSLPAGDGPLELVRYTAVAVPDTAAPNVDVSGNEVRYDADNMLDGVAETCWRMPGSGADDEIVFTFEAAVELTEVGLINGYAKTSGDFDWYNGNRRILAVEWIFDDGTAVEQTLEGTRKLQSLPIRAVTTTTVTLRLVDVSEPGRGRAARDYTAISDVSLVGVPAEDQ